MFHQIKCLDLTSVTISGILTSTLFLLPMDNDKVFSSHKFTRFICEKVKWKSLCVVFHYYYVLVCFNKTFKLLAGICILLIYIYIIGGEILLKYL